MVKRTNSKSIRLLAKSNITIVLSEDLQEAAVDKDQDKTILEMFSSKSNTSLTTVKLQTTLSTIRTAKQMIEDLIR